MFEAHFQTFEDPEGGVALAARLAAFREELAREQAQTEATFLSRLQTLGGFGGKSDQLNAYQVSV